MLWKNINLCLIKMGNLIFITMWDFLLGLITDLYMNTSTMVAHNCHGERNNLAAKEKESQQREEPHGKRKNLTAQRKNFTAKRKRLTAKEKKKPHDKREKPQGKEKTSR